MIVNEIESRLLNASIAPAQFSPTDKPITGSKYITYRNDLNENGTRAMTAMEVMKYPPEGRYNHFNRPDPFAGIEIKPHPELGATPSSSMK